MLDLSKIVDNYIKLRTDRQSAPKKFLNDERPYMIFQTPDGDIWGDNRTPEQCFNANIKYIEASLTVASDHLPVLEPWFGTGVYANMYGSKYVWRDGEAPATHYMFSNIDEVKNLKKPNWNDSEIAHLILDTIRYFKSKTGDAIPIICTDTQSASDTATLLLDASEVFIGCLLEPEIMYQFMNDINQCVIEFTQVQSELIGNALLKPGHIMLCQDNFSGYSISDDNLAVGSPSVNRQFNLPLNEHIGQALGGVAIHSCGNWTHTMPFIKELVPSCVSIDCAIDESWDPNPNTPSEVRDAMAGSGIAIHARLSGKTDVMLEQAKDLLHPDLKLIIHPNYIDDYTAAKNYEALEHLLSGYY
ncbi:uroporphyrinogen decarboxylase family protein [Vallitalea guaymasensis]|uniref:Uroporphyrinogen decarboxylase (URO-D) domain-containing protein n=1 Tax=Vallitalea guaymasensis TaxID=1185412 RepID=A0A8J8MEJ7_9FIRM|nr:uroporphyrinogen decarboxylase family protein [Vallitalea guaymasensis]QUH31634.1 hypothetical protein HYG85_22965 [Vallitalea guaymasensis]